MSNTVVDSSNLGHLISKIKAAFWPKTDVIQIGIDDSPVSGSNNLVRSNGIYNSITGSINSLVAVSGSTWSDKGVIGITVKSGSSYLTGDTTVTGTGTASIDLATAPKNAISWVYGNSGSVATTIANTHTHSNKAVLDGITAAATASWNTAATNSHTHSNKTVLDGITSPKVSSWDSTSEVVSTSSSIWSSKQDPISDLGTIRTQAASGSDAFNWIKSNSSSINSATASAHSHSNKAVLDGITAAMTASWQTAATNSHTHSNKAILDGITAAMTSSWKDTATVVSASSSIWSEKQDAIFDLGTIRNNAASGSAAHAWIESNSSSISTAVTDSHTHANEAILDRITATVTASWNAAAANSHTHSNKALLDSITGAMTSSWATNTTYTFNSGSSTTGFSVTGSDGTSQSVSVGFATSAGTASIAEKVQGISGATITGSITAAINSLVAASESKWSDKGVTSITVISGSNYLSGNSTITSTGTSSLDLATKSKNAVDWVIANSGSIFTESIDITALAMTTLEIDEIWEDN